ncbi:hypothetical protein quinque_005166 [Culex quinquefasciatus]
MQSNAVLVAALRHKIQQSFQLAKQYDWLIDSYVLDFYVDNHWDRLPASWNSCFEQLEISQLKSLLTVEPKSTECHVWPLSILASRVLLGNLCLNRKLPPDDEPESEPKEQSRFRERQKLFNKSVKLKKRHEIEQFSRQCWESGRQTGIEHLVDIGSGQGNLARTLAYGFDFNVCCIEQNEGLVATARQKDEELSFRLKRQCKAADLKHPVHLSKKVNLEDVDPGQFAQMIRDTFNVEKNSPFQFGLVGLHPCGDLATSLIKLFLACPEAKFIKLVCCCYMKLSTEQDRCQNYGFPLSSFSKQIGLNLSYEAREIACHAIEQYDAKLEHNFEELKVHAFRAALEKVLIQIDPALKHSGIKSTKVTNLTFQQYCERATSGMGITLPRELMDSENTRTNLANWRRVVKFYTLRLMFAPLVESIILYDRWLFLLEQGVDSDIRVVFDPICSPRNHAITGRK